MKILVVEDEIGLAEAICAILRKEGYSVTMANDGKSGLEKALSNDFDCIILDIMMPVMNGLDVLTFLRVKNIETPVLLLTAKSEVDDKIKGLDCISIGPDMDDIHSPKERLSVKSTANVWEFLKEVLK